MLALASKQPTKKNKISCGDSDCSAASLTEEQESIIAEAKAILASTLQATKVLGSSKAVKDFCSLELCSLEREAFGVLFLNTKNNLIKYEELFVGSISSCQVYPREIAKRALNHNASAVILAHNHPSGNTKPSPSDLNITKIIKSALSSLDIAVLDHIIVAPTSCTSFAEESIL